MSGSGRPDLNGKGDAHGGGWYVLARPEGKRCLIVAARGKTVSRLGHGEVLHRWRSGVPCGSPETATKEDLATVIECVYYEPTRTYVAVDVMSWGGYSLYDCTAEFRFYWLRTKLGELDGSVGDYGILPAPYFDADDAGIRRAYEGVMPFVRDGLLFYNKQGHYALGLTPLVALYKDASCTRYFAPADEGLFVVLAHDAASGDLRTLDGTPVPRLRTPADPPLRDGDLARFSLAEAPQGQGGLAATFDRKCSHKRALPDTASKIAFALRHKHGSPLAIGDILAVAAGAVS